jgi:rhodanese-related sulfurtransferase
VALAALAVPSRAQTPSAKDRVSVDELKTLLARHAAVVIDVRQPVVFAQGHIPGSLSVPDVTKQIALLKDRKKLIVAYCS